VEIIAELVNMQLCKQFEPLTLDAIVDILCSGWFGNIYDVLEREHPCHYDKDETRDEHRKKWDARNKRERELATKVAQEWMAQEDVVGKKPYVFRFDDGDGPINCAMEHGDLFKNLPHLHISHH
jgi:hypothetical protein